jgi:hypothetical protein
MFCIARKVRQAEAVQVASRTERPVDRWLSDATREGHQDVYLGKRRHLRYFWRMPVNIEVASVDGKRFSLYGQTRDISERGIGLECRQPLEPDSLLRIRLDGQTDAVEGYVVHCTVGLGIYRIGVILTTGQAA